MKLLLLLGIATSVAALQALAADADDLQMSEFERLRQSQFGTSDDRATGRPEVDAKAIINESNAFLKEREPEMTAEEYALYEKVVAMLDTNPKFALRLLEGMTNEKKEPSPAFEFILGNIYYSAGKIDEAERSYRNATNRFPSFLRAWNNLGVLYYSANRYEEAVPCFSRSVVLGDKDPMTLGLLGYCLERIDDVVSAEMSYMQALAGDPGNSSWKEGLLRIYVKGGQYGRAESLVRRLIKERPGDTRFWLAYANLLVKDGRKLRAMALLEAAVQAGLAGQEELLLLGDLYAEQQLVPEAIAIYQRVLNSGSSLGERKLLFFAQALVASRKFGEADEVLKSLPASLPDESAVTAIRVRAELQAAQEKWPEARTQWQALLAREPMNGNAWIGMGVAYTAEGDTVHAAFAFEAALKDASTAYRAHLELANLELKSRHYAETVNHLEDALAILDTEPVRAYLAQIKSLLVNPTGDRS